MKMDRMGFDPMAVATEIQRVFYTIDNIVWLFSAIGGALDYWAADHDVSAEELESHLEGLFKSAKGVHGLIGLPPKGEGLALLEDINGQDH